jgi:hypothetical protein
MAIDTHLFLKSAVLSHIRGQGKGLGIENRGSDTMGLGAENPRCLMYGARGE